MKLLLVSFLLLLVSVQGWSRDAEIYVQPMYCFGKTTGKVSHVDPSYYQLLMKLESVYSKRADGSYASTLIVSNAYYGPKEKVNVQTASWGEVWYMGALRVSGTRVYRPSLSGRGDNLELQVTSASESRTTLKGTWLLKDTVSGNFGYNLDCFAKVVAKPSRVLDFTKK